MTLLDKRVNYFDIEVALRVERGSLPLLQELRTRHPVSSRLERPLPVSRHEDRAKGLEAVHLWHLHVHHDDVWVHLAIISIACMPSIASPTTSQAPSRSVPSGRHFGLRADHL
ncbi:MAG: hypothetical protein QF590_02520 [Dehalococcoidia bacterium]|nr:hypothetical protein [Dehalococcoidia bacterium]MDP7090151.1 hypothetical protein [Dehalococcoidia bacterium]MDP7262726.1 hypothetical protein [Dehalococcoidia bacterium]